MNHAARFSCRSVGWVMPKTSMKTRVRNWKGFIGEWYACSQTHSLQGDKSVMNEVHGPNGFEHRRAASLRFGPQRL